MPRPAPKLTVEQWPIDRPQPYARNPRKISPAAIAKVAASIKAFGFRQPIVVDRKDVIVVGHARLMGARALGLTEVPVHVAKDLSERDARAYRLADNRSNEESVWDVELLKLELKDLGKDAGELTGFDAEELEEYLGGPAIAETPAPVDQAAALARKWGTAAGQAWQIGPHRLICGDSTEGADVGRLWPNGGPLARLIWTDPPYGVDLGAKNDRLNKTDRGRRITKPIAGDDTPADELVSKALSIANSKAGPGAGCYVASPAGALLPGFIAAIATAGFPLRHILVWVKNQFVISQADYHSRFEPILYGWKEGAHWFVNDRKLDDVFEINKPQASPFHPTTKPVALVAAMIRNSSRAGELVYDPFCGSGTTLIAAHQMGRVGYGVEIDPCYVAVILERLSLLGLKPKLMKA